MTLLEALLLAMTAMYFIAQLVVLYNVRGVPMLEEVDAPDPPRWPTVSLVIAACNEESTIEGALKTLLALDYPALQIIVVNDRSTDRTGAILERMREENGRMEIVRIETLPEGWLGKLHALYRGDQAASGDYVLYADADIHFSPDCLRRAVAWAEHDGLDHLSVIPRMHIETVALGAAVNAFGGVVLSTFRPRAINADKPGAYGGVGAFNLVRKAAFDRTEGWPWLRLEIADDMGLGLLLHRHGAKARMCFGFESLAVSWYASLPEMIRGLEKNTFAVMGRFSATRAVLAASAFLAFALAPWALLATPWMPAGVLAIASAVAVPWLTPKPPGMPVLSYILGPMAGPVLVYILLRSTWITKRRGALVWRGTEYDLDELRRNQRVFV